MSKRAVLVLTGTLMLAIAVAGCGRRGSPEPPPGVDKEPPPAPVEPGERPNKPFVLDPLL